MGLAGEYLKSVGRDPSDKSNSGLVIYFDTLKVALEGEDKISSLEESILATLRSNLDISIKMHKSMSDFILTERKLDDLFDGKF